MKTPSEEKLEEWFHNCECETPDGCVVELDGTCEHGQDSWFVILNLV